MGGGGALLMPDAPRREVLQGKIRLVALTPETLGVGCNGLGEEGFN